MRFRALRQSLAALAAVLLVSCGGGGGEGVNDSKQRGSTGENVDARLRQQLAAHGVAAPARPVVPDALFNLGQALFSSTLLSGTRTVSCASCHATGNSGLDNLALGIGTGGSGSGSRRTGTPVIHRNTPNLINLAVGGRSALFWDGRVQLRDGAFDTPAGAALPANLNDLLAAQALFPLLSRSEMLGEYNLADDNAVADLVPPDVAVESHPTPVWNALMQRLRDDRNMANRLLAAYPDTPLEAQNIGHVANALSAFQARRWYALGNSNRLLGYAAGTHDLPAAAKRGGLLFFDKAQCVRCHSGPLLSDQKFHNLAMPQQGPGFGIGATLTPPHDLGRYGVSGLEKDRYAFLTPSLWEVRNSFPYGHAGTYETLEQVVRHHLDAATAAQVWRCPAKPAVAGTAITCLDTLNAPQLYADMLANLDPLMRSPIALSDAEITDLVAFLETMTDGNNDSVR